MSLSLVNNEAKLGESSCKYDYTKYDLDTILRGQAFIRRFLIRRRFRMIVAARLQRFKIAKELLETERSYVMGLETIIKLCLDKLKRDKNESKEPLLTNDQIYTIFSNIRNIYDMNKTLLADLETRFRDWKERDYVGDIFLSMAPFLKSYTYYCQNFDSAIATLKLIRNQSPPFDSFLNKFQTETKQTIQTLLITPVQRIPRYILLIDQMLKVTPLEHQDYDPLIKSREQLQSITQKVNHGIEHAESVTKVVSLQHEFGELLPEGITSLVKAGRYFVREGQVQFCNLDSRIHKNYKDYWIFLFNDALLYARFKSKEGERYSNFGLVNFEKDLKVKDIIEDTEMTKNMFFIITKERTFTCRCSTLEEKTKWMEDILHYSSTTSLNLKSLSPLSHYEKNQENSISISIVGTTLSHKKNQEYTAYMINVSLQIKGRSSPTEIMVSHRYSEFDRLRKILEPRFPLGKKLTELPSKHIIGNLQKDIVQSRRVMLQSFLEELLADTYLKRQHELLDFLQVPRDFFDPFASLDADRLIPSAHLTTSNSATLGYSSPSWTSHSDKLLSSRSAATLKPRKNAFEQFLLKSKQQLSRSTMIAGEELETSPTSQRNNVGATNGATWTKQKRFMETMAKNRGNPTGISSSTPTQQLMDTFSIGESQVSPEDSLGKTPATNPSSHSNPNISSTSVLDNPKNLLNNITCKLKTPRWPPNQSSADDGEESKKESLFARSKLFFSHRNQQAICTCEPCRSVKKDL